MKDLNIKKQYNDALYWATSTQTKNEDYHLTRILDAILRKLIHYSRTYEKITYSNEIIAQHTFIGEESIRKAIPVLAKKNYISTATFKIFDSGEIKTRRTIFIKWDFIQTIKDKVPTKEESQEAIDAIDIPIDKPIKEVIDAPIPEQKQLKQIANDNKTTPTSTQIGPDDYPIPDLIITDEKLNWFKKKIEKPELSREMVGTLSQEELKEAFYGSGGVWRMNSSSIENQYQMKFTHRGGSKCSISDNSTKHDRIEVNIKDFGYYLGQSGILFDKFTPKQYRDIKTYGLVKKPTDFKEPCYII